MTEDDTFKALCRMSYSQLVDKLGEWHRFNVNSTRERLLDDLVNEKELQRVQRLNSYKIFGNIEPVLVDRMCPRVEKILLISTSKALQNTGWDAEDYLSKIEQDLNEHIKKARVIAKKRKITKISSIASSMSICAVLGYFLGVISFFIIPIAFGVNFLFLAVSILIQEKLFPYDKDTEEFGRILDR